MRELNHFTGGNIGQSMDSGDTVTNFKYRSDFSNVNLTFELLDFLLDYRGDFVSTDFHCDPLVVAESLQGTEFVSAF